MKEAIIFDFDGVIIESETSTFKLIQNVLKQDHGIDVSLNLLDKKLGKPTLTFLKDCFGNKLTEMQINAAYSKIKTETSNNLTKYIKPHNSVIDFIKKNADNYNFAVASMNTQAYIKLVLAHYNIADKIKVIVTREEVIKHKPNPEIYIKTLKHLECSPSDALVIEDTPVGVKAANNAGIGCVVVLNGLNKRIDFKDVKVKLFVDVDKFNVD